MFGVILFVYLFYLQGTDQDCIHPKTTLVLLNHTATIFCYESNTGESQLIINRSVVDTTVLSDMDDIQFQKSNTSGDGTVNVNVNLTVTVNATIQTNNTSVQCSFLSPGCGLTEIAFFIVLETPPTPPDPISVTIVGLDTMKLSWTPTWLHPINSYTVHVKNTFLQTKNSYNTTNTSMIFEKQLNTSCYELTFAVSVNSEVGNSSLSDTDTKGYPKDISTLDLQNVINSINITTGTTDEQPTLIIQLQTIPVCDYEVISYQFDVKNCQTNVSLVKIIESSEETSINATLIIEDGFIATAYDEIVINITITNEADQQRSIINITNQSLPFPVPQSESVSIIQSTSISLQSSVSLDQPIIIGSIVSGCVAVIALSVLVTIVLLIVVYRKKGKRSVHVTNFNFPNMTPNDIYVSTNDHGCVSKNDHGYVSTNHADPLYDTVQSPTYDLITNTSSVGGTEEYIDMSILTHPIPSHSINNKLLQSPL